MLLDPRRATVTVLQPSRRPAVPERQLSPLDRARRADPKPFGRLSARQPAFNRSNNTVLKRAIRLDPSPLASLASGDRETENRAHVTPCQFSPFEKRSKSGATALRECSVTSRSTVPSQSVMTS